MTYYFPDGSPPWKPGWLVVEFDSPQASELKVGETITTDGVPFVVESVEGSRVRARRDDEAMKRRGGFTIVELLVVISIISLLTAMFLGALSASQNAARKSKTQAMVARLSEDIAQRWENYRTRRISASLVDPAGSGLVNPAVASYASSQWGFSWGSLTPSQVPPAQQQVLWLEMRRELQRLELPCRWDDIATGTWPNATTPTSVPITAVPAVALAYLRAYNSSNIAGVQIEPTTDYEGAECLYLIITMGGVDVEASPIDQFRSMDVGDFDRDGMKEFHDGWGNPISFIRWPTMFISDQQQDVAAIEANGAAAIQSFCREYHDPLDTMRVDMPASGATTARGYKLVPLVFSAGEDQVLGVERGHAGNDPYDRTGTPAGTTSSSDDGGWLDNITNHNLGSQVK